eukprot:6191285-Pleurochrysis_carterae.AAC.1
MHLSCAHDGLSMWDRAGILKIRRASRTCTAPAAGVALFEVIRMTCTSRWVPSQATLPIAD